MKMDKVAGISVAFACVLLLSSRSRSKLHKQYLEELKRLISDAGPAWQFLKERLNKTGLCQIGFTHKLIIARQLSFEFKYRKSQGIDSNSIRNIMKRCLVEKVKVATKGADGSFKCPKKRFGCTELQMSILTLGGMRAQRSWGDNIKNMSQIDPICHQNFVAIIRRAVKLGINHFETARSYGCSELQYGLALRHLLGTGILETAC